MKHTYIILLFLVATSTSFAQSKFYIKPKGYSETTGSVVNNSNQLSRINNVGGHFRLKEFVSSEQKVVETDIVTYFIGKGNENKIRFSVNCAKQINLHFVIADHSNKHKIDVKENEIYHRFEKDLDISTFKNGQCTISVFNEKNELIHLIEFEKASI